MTESRGDKRYSYIETRARARGRTRIFRLNEENPGARMVRELIESWEQTK